MERFGAFCNANDPAYFLPNFFVIELTNDAMNKALKVIPAVAIVAKNWVQNKKE
ncbi:hypothetical protein ACN7OV_00470 [Aerococcus urinaeequi]